VTKYTEYSELHFVSMRYTTADPKTWSPMKTCSMGDEEKYIIRYDRCYLTPVNGEQKNHNIISIKVSE